MVNANQTRNSGYMKDFNANVALIVSLVVE